MTDENSQGGPAANAAPAASGGGVAAGADKRQHERLAVECALIVRDGEQRLGTVEDFSRGGMRVRLDGDIGDNEEVREWTGHRGTDNKEFVLTNLVGEEFDLSLGYMTMNLGNLKARLIRVIRSMKKIYFAMQFTQADAALIDRVLTIVNRGKRK